MSIQQLVDEFLAEFWLTAGTIGFAPIGLGLFETSVALPTPTEMTPTPRCSWVTAYRMKQFLTPVGGEAKSLPLQSRTAGSLAGSDRRG